jgi:hypothetical protein
VLPVRLSVIVSVSLLSRLLVGAVTSEASGFVLISLPFLLSYACSSIIRDARLPRRLVVSARPRRPLNDSQRAREH